MMRHIAVVCLLFIGVSVMAQTSGEIKSLQDRRKEALASIEETTRLISSTKKSTLSTLNALNLLGTEIKTRRDLIQLLNQEINGIEKEQRRIAAEVSRLSDDLSRKKKNYAKAICGIYAKRSGYDQMMFILSASTLSQSYRRMRYLQEYSAWRKHQAAEIVEQQTQLGVKKDELDKVKSSKRDLLSKRENETRDLRVKESKQKEVVSELKKKEKSLKSELAKQQRQASELNRKIEQLIAEEARKAAKKADSKSTVKGGYAMTKVEKELSDSFEKNRGKLPFPLSGSYIIVGRFGQQQHQELKYVKTNNNGIDLQTKPGTNARAIFNGEVTKVFVVPGYNSSVIIRHGNYLTVYSNLSEVYVKAGEKVTTRQSIGKIYTDSEDGDRTVLHFQIWKETTKINPEVWLDK